MRIALIFDRTRPDTTGGYFERASRYLNVPCDHWWLRDVTQIPPEYGLYLRIDHGDDYEVRLPERLRPAVFYALDTHLLRSWKRIRRAATRYDWVFCCHRDAVGRLPRTEWLPVACDPELHGAHGQHQRWDVAFVGTDGGVPRKFYLQALRERYPSHFIGCADHTQLGAIYGEARIGFNYSIANDVNMRVFEVLAAGTLLLTNTLRGDDLQRLGLYDGRHLVLYDTPEVLFDRIDYFLAHPEERDAIARAGAEMVGRQHTYAHRLKQVLATVSRELGLDVPTVTAEVTPCTSS